MTTCHQHAPAIARQLLEAALDRIDAEPDLDGPLLSGAYGQAMTLAAEAARQPGQSVSLRALLEACYALREDHRAARATRHAG